MEARTCRSGRTGSPPRGETFGYASGLEEGERLRGKMREPLGGEKRIRRNAQRGVMVEAPPAPPFEVIQPQLVLQLLVVRSIRQRSIASRTRSARVAVGGSVASQYLIGAASARGHSMSSHSSGRGVERQSSRCAGRTRTAAKRERIAPRVPWRQVTVRQARAGGCWARVRTLSGRCRPVRRTSVGGRPWPRYFGGGSGARPGAQTVVSVLMPTTYGMARAVSASRNAVTTP